MKPFLSGILLACLPLLGAQWGMGPGPGTPHTTSSCTLGPTTNMLLQLDAPAPGVVSTWVSGVGGITGAASGTINSVASIFGSSPGVRLTASSLQYFTLSSPVNSSFLNDVTVMVAWKPATLSSGVGQYFTSGLAGADTDTLAYWVANVGTTQGADSQDIAQIGTGTASFTASSLYQMNFSYKQSSSRADFRLNKATDTTVSPAFPVLTHPIQTIGAANAGGNGFVDGWIGAIYIFGPALNLTDIQTWETYLSCKYPGV